MCFMLANGHVYETFGISESKTVKPLQILLSVTTSKLPLSAKYFIYIVRHWDLFIIKNLHSFIALFFVLFGSTIFSCVWAAILFDKFWSCVGFLSDLAMCMTAKGGIIQFHIPLFYLTTSQLPKLP